VRPSLAAASAQDGSVPIPLADPTRRGRGARRIAIGAWVVILVLLLRHREVISSDTLSNYIHVWFVADRFWHGHGLPFRMPVLAHGQALAFPYGFIPWMFAVLLWPIMGEWSVTLSLGVGFVGLVLATFWAFPELRRGWWAVATLVNPAFTEGLLLGQLPFLWAAAMLLLAVGCWRRERYKTAIALAALAQITHAPVLIPLVAALVLARYRFEPAATRRRLRNGWLLTLVPAIPAIYLVFASPVTAQTSPLFSLWVEVETVALRSLVLVVPFGLLWFQRHRLRANTPILVAAVLLVGQLVTIPISGMVVGWGALTTSPDAQAIAITRLPEFVKGATYRVLSAGDGKYSQYAVVRAGGRLDSEFFPESLHRHSFLDAPTYARFLTDRQVDFVVVDGRYHRFKTNEQQLLDQMAASGACTNGVAVRNLERAPALSVYSVTRGCSAS
jgi:hypothetical protein